ncbi:hypothetical protein M9458_052756 [Cirrhinus mrigala]|uniref:ribonuclease H n=1 Tax=Cirrhinus mrigala TaxID=683832 RepID=A0ABD0MPF7_CIRMR
MMLPILNHGSAFDRQTDPMITTTWNYRGYNYPFIDPREHSQPPAVAWFMPWDYSQDKTYTDVNRRPVSHFSSTEPQGYRQPYHNHLATSLFHHEERPPPRDMQAHHARYERHSDYYERPTQIYAGTLRQPADYAQPYHPVRPPSPNPYVEPSYRGPIPTIPNFCNLYVNSRYPYTNAMRSLTALYGQPHELALQRIAELMNGPKIKSGDIRSFRLYALQVRALVGMLDQLGAKGSTELKCGSHVSRLLAKLPHDLRANFRRFVNPIQIPVPTLLDLSDWLKYELRIQEHESQYTSNPSRAYFKKEKPKRYCPFCNTVQHYFNQCANFKLLNQDQVECWLKSNQKCFKCGRDHLISQCNLKAKCKKCDKRHLEILHDFNAKMKPELQASAENSCLVSSEVETLYLDRPTASNKVLLKVSRVILRNEAELFSNVQKLWQMDTLPYRSKKLITRSKRDTEAMQILEDGSRKCSKSDKDVVTAHLRRTEKHLSQNADLASVYVHEVTPEKPAEGHRTWYIPHHIVQHNEKHRIVFNCSFKHKGTSLNDHLLPGPILGPTLLGVLLHFREHPVAISSDIKGMFHQVGLLEEDKPFLRFLWRNLDQGRAPTVFEWQILPFGAVCSPCCATFALQKHVYDHSKPEEDVHASVEHHFYVDNWLQSFPSADEAQTLVIKMQKLLSEGF